MSPSSEPTAAVPQADTARHELAVVLPANLHARPAGRLARAAAGVGCAVQLEYGGRTVDPTGVLAVMGLGATAGGTVTVRAEGPGARQAVAALAEILATAE
jgi:phosphotransferase system HPr (HPr) family protein